MNEWVPATSIAAGMLTLVWLGCGGGESTPGTNQPPILEFLRQHDKAHRTNLAVIPSEQVRLANCHR